MTQKRSKQTVWIVPDKARVIRYSELREIYEREGSIRRTAAAIGSTNPTTIMRYLREAGIIVQTTQEMKLLKERIVELEAQLKERGQEE